MEPTLKIPSFFATSNKQKKLIAFEFLRQNSNEISFNYNRLGVQTKIAKIWKCEWSEIDFFKFLRQKSIKIQWNEKI